MNKAKLRLRDNIRQLIQSGEVPYSAWLESDAVANSSLGRIVSDEGQNLTLDGLDLLAYALGVEAWQLLHPDPEAATLSKTALKIAREMDSLKPEAREAAYALFVHQIEFGNVKPPESAGAANGRAAKKPRALRKVHR